MRHSKPRPLSGPLHLMSEADLARVYAGERPPKKQKQPFLRRGWVHVTAAVALMAGLYSLTIIFPHPTPVASGKTKSEREAEALARMTPYERCMEGMFQMQASARAGLRISEQACLKYK